MRWEPKGKFAFSHVKNSKSSGPTNTHVLLLSNQEHLHTPEENQV